MQINLNWGRAIYSRGNKGIATTGESKNEFAPTRGWAKHIYKIKTHLVRSPCIESSNSKTEIFASWKVNIIASLFLPPSMPPEGNTPNDSTLPCNLHHKTKAPTKCWRYVCSTLISKYDYRLFLEIQNNFMCCRFKDYLKYTIHVTRFPIIKFKIKDNSVLNFLIMYLQETLIWKSIFYYLGSIVKDFKYANSLFIFKT